MPEDEYIRHSFFTSEMELSISDPKEILNREVELSIVIRKTFAEARKRFSWNINAYKNQNIHSNKLKLGL